MRLRGLATLARRSFRTLSINGFMMRECPGRLNPVRAHMAPTASDWLWNSYRATIGKVPSPPRLKTDGIEAIFASAAEGRHQFIEFVQDGVGGLPCWAAPDRSDISRRVGLLVSRARWIVSAAMHPIQANLNEVLVAQRNVRPAPARRWEAQLPPEQSLAEQAPTTNDLAERNRAIIDSFASGSFTMRAIGEHFGIHYSRVSRIISAAECARRKT